MSALERIQYIDVHIRESGCVRLKTVAERFETSERQVRRDIEYMRYRLNSPIIYRRESRQYEYSEPFTSLANLDQKALFFYVFSRAAAGTLAYVPMAEKKGLETILEAIPRDLRSLISRISYELPGYELPEQETLSVLILSLSEKRRFDACYRKVDGAYSERQAVALHLVNYAGVWYCLVWDLAKQDFRIFRLSRISRISLSREQVPDLPDDRRIKDFLAQSYGVFKGTDVEAASVRFYGWARSVVEHEIWHADQSSITGTDPERGHWIQLTLPASHFQELLGRILRFGAMAEPIAPSTLRAAWQAEITRMYESAIKKKEKDNGCPGDCGKIEG